MKDLDKLNYTVEPFYEQFTRIGELFEDRLLPYKFTKKGHKIFAAQYRFELKLYLRAENRNLKHEFKLEKRKDKARFKREKRDFKFAERKLRKAEKLKRKKEKSKCKSDRDKKEE